MGQRTQVVVNIHNKNNNIESFAIHNQCGFGRPTVTAMLAICEYVIKEEYDFNIEKKPLHAIACRPFGFDEYFNWSEPYDCSSQFLQSEHDNDNGYAIVNIFLGEDKTVSYQLYSNNGKAMSIDEYIGYTNAHTFITKEWIKWKNERVKMIGKYLDTRSKI